MDTLKVLLNLILIAAIPVCVASFAHFLSRKTEQVKAQTENDTTKAILDEVNLAVSAAVAYVSQTYVDAIKETGPLEPAAQEMALRKCIYSIRCLLTPAVSQYIREHVSNLDDFLIPRIEAEVRKQKQMELAPLMGPDTTVSLSEENVMELAQKAISGTSGEITEDLVEKLRRAFEAMPVTTEDSQQAESSKEGENPSNPCAEPAGI